MAIPFLIAIDLTQNELQNAVVQNLSSNPSSPVEAQIYWHTTDKTIRIWNGSAWRSIPYVSTTTPAANQVAGSGSAGSSFEAARADHQHAGVALATAGVNGFMPGTDKTKLDAATASPTASTLVLRDGSGRAQFADPSAAQDAATKAYVDATSSGLDLKASVRAATAAALPSNTRSTNVLTASSNGALAAIDGVTLIVGDRLLVKDEATGANNGIYVVTTVGDGSNPFVLTRATDADASAEVTAGMFTFVEEGTANADSGWVLTTNSAITLNTTALAFAQFSGAGQIVAGAGLTKSGNTLNVGAGTGITVNADDVAIDTSVVARKYAASVGDGSSTQIDVTHSLGTRDVIVNVYRVASPYETVHCDMERLDTNTVRVRFAVAPTSNQYRVVVHG